MRTHVQSNAVLLAFVDLYSETFISFYCHVAKLMHMLTQLYWIHNTLLPPSLPHHQIYSEFIRFFAQLDVKFTLLI